MEIEIKEAFKLYEEYVPSKHAMLLKTSLALRRNGIESVEQLFDIYMNNKKELTYIRDIGPKRLELIKDILVFFEERETEV